MRRLTMALLASGLLCGYFQAQQVHYPHPLQGVLEPHRYMERGVIEHQHGTATVKADCARPLAQAITAVREEYGWAVDYEDPPYHSKYDVMDMTNPSYRAAILMRRSCWAQRVEHFRAPIRKRQTCGVRPQQSRRCWRRSSRITTRAEIQATSSFGSSPMAILMLWETLSTTTREVTWRLLPS